MTLNPEVYYFLFSIVNSLTKAVRFLLLPWLAITYLFRRIKPAKIANLDPEKLSALKAKFTTYLGASKKFQDKDGFIESQGCDSLLFSGLYGTLPTTDVHIIAAMGEGNQWFRRPLSLPECLNCGGAGSTISRDMFEGLLWYIWINKRLDLAEDVYQYGLKNGWVMGEGNPSTLYFTPGLRGLLSDIIYRLGGKNRLLERSLPNLYSTSNLDFTAHLDALYIVLRSEVNGYITAPALKVLKAQSERQPKNAFFTYAYAKYTNSDFSPALSTLLDTQLFPADSLPTTANYAENEWLWQRDYGHDWQPDDKPPKPHNGADWLFVANLMLKEH